MNVFNKNADMQDDFGDKNDPVLTFKGVSTEPDPLFDSPFWDVTFTLSQGELLLIRLERERFRLPLADLAAGVVDPDRGIVEFLGKNWRQLRPDHSSMQRGKIGRVFEDYGWISNLDIGQNITLAQRHHSTRSDSDIEEEAIHLAKIFGLPGLPRQSHTGARREDLMRSALIRAFLGDPALIILERPTRNLFPGIMPALMNAIRAARDRGCAIIWTTSDAQVWKESGIHANLKCTMFGSRMNEIEEGDHG